MIDEREQPGQLKRNLSYGFVGRADSQPSRAHTGSKHYDHKASLIFFGNERLATGVDTEAPTLAALVKAGYNVAAVVSNYEQGRSRNARRLEIMAVANKYNIPVHLPSHPRNIAEQLNEYKPSIGVLVAYGKIVPQSIIDIFPHGIVNIHPSLLPSYRGPTPIEQVILDGAKKTGVSIMKLVKGMDAGPIFAQSEVALTGSETKQSLADTLLEIGSTMLVEILPGILDGSIVGLPQDESLATYDNLISKKDGLIDWRKSAKEIEREVRAFKNWPQSSAFLANKMVIVTKGHVINYQGTPGTILEKKDKLVMACGKEALEIVALKPAGKPEMTAKAFVAGYADLL